MAPRPPILNWKVMLLLGIAPQRSASYGLLRWSSCPTHNTQIRCKIKSRLGSVSHQQSYVMLLGTFSYVIARR
ncbi:hypothetical protein F5B18DRAFT_625461 [Nemania serpens]|nr:hypothetical protein F5B18DRAFT_625461 [Nemania serpens]